MWFDSWKSLAILSAISDIKPDATTDNNALLLVGPVLGSPYIVKINNLNYFMLPVLLEVDKAIKISVVAKNIFSFHELKFQIQTLSSRPTIFEIGPLQVILKIIKLFYL
jgi:hypothetical protein